MNPGDLTKVTYHTDTKKINKYINTKSCSGYKQFLEKIIENGPFATQICDVRLFWIGKLLNK